MAVTQPLSVTQSTAPVAKAAAKTDPSAWQQALAGAQSTPRQGSTANADHEGHATAKAVSDKDAQDTGQAALPAAPALPAGQTGKPKATSTGASLPPAIATKDDRKDSTQNNIAAAVNLPVQTMADAPANAPPAKVPEDTSQVSGHVEAAVSGQKSGSSPQAGAVSPEPGIAYDAACLPDSGTADTASAAPAHPTLPLKPAAQAASAAPPAVQQSASTQTNAASTANIAAPADTQTTTSAARSVPQHPEGTAAPQVAASSPAPSSTAQALTVRAAQMPEADAAMPDSKEKDSTQPISALGGMTTATAALPTTGTNTSAALTQTSDAASTGGVGTSPSALAATVTALHQSGQAGTVLRLDPPGLGHLSVQVGLGAQGQVNVLFVPSSADAAQAIQSSLPGLGSAMAQSGLTLGQAQVGGQFSQQGGQNGQGGYTPPRQGNANNFTTETQITTSGLSAYA